MVEYKNTSIPQNTYPIYKGKNWRIASEYEVCKTFSPNKWAWEFLRRNSAYQEDYYRILPLFLKERDEWYSRPEHQGKVYSHLGVPNLPATNEDFIIPQHGSAEKWGILAYQDPNNDRILSSFDKYAYQTCIVGSAIYTAKDEENTSIVGLKEIQEGKIAVIIDLGLPIDKQLSFLKKHLTEMQNRLKIRVSRQTPNMIKAQTWISYLRVLDAYHNIQERLITRLEASNIIFKNPPNPEQKFDDTRRQALVIVEKDYHFIL